MGIGINDIELDLVTELPRETYLDHIGIFIFFMHVSRFRGSKASLRQKSKRIRGIPINSELRKLFVKLKLTRNGNQYVLQNPMTGKPFLDFGRSWKTLLTGTGIDGVRFHDCRHTFASHFLMNGGDLYTLKELLGHRELNTTARCLTITTAYKNQAIELFTVAESESNIIDLSRAAG